jgi:hypothetical protein
MTVARVSSAYWHSKVLHVANRLDVFNRLSGKPLSADELAREAGADARGLDILLIAVTSLGFLERVDGRYRNSPLATTFLVKTSPRYQGGIVSMFESWYPTWDKLYDASGHRQAAGSKAATRRRGDSDLHLRHALPRCGASAPAGEKIPLKAART